MFPEILREARSLVLDRITNLIHSESKVSESMLYTSTAESKMIRSALLLSASKKNTDLSESSAINLATSIELLHSYSLIHDDLPSMDNDDLRRGKPTVHIKWDEATAVLVGDALQAFAYQILSDKKTHPNANVRCNLINELSKASGATGMVGGQMLDLDAEKKKLSLSEILMLQKLKTGELFRFSCVAGPILSEQKDLKHFEEFANNLGLAFQIKDDLLDVEGDEKQVGKKTKKDLTRGKETLISYLGKEDAKKKSEDLINDSKQILKFYGKKANRIIDLTNFVISRNN